MKKIEKLTAEQEALVPVYLKKWLDVGYRTETTDRDKAKACLDFLYTKIMKVAAPKYVIFLDSPMACQLAANLLKDTKFASLLSSQLDSQLRSQLHSQLYSLLDSLLRSQLVSQLVSQLHSQLYSQLDSQLVSQLASQLASQLVSQLVSQKLEYFSYNPSFWWWPGWVGFYDFVLNELLPGQRPHFALFNELIEHWKHAHYYLLFNDIAFVSDFPKEVNLDQSHRLHSEQGAALLYRDTYGVFSLRGVPVPSWAIETPKDEIDPKKILELSNTEQRTALMRHVGLEKFLKELKAEEIDSQGDYHLYYLTVEGTKIGPYLKMTDSSSSRVFLEGAGNPDKYESLDPTIKTVIDALKWRAAKASKNFMTKFNIKLEGEA